MTMTTALVRLQYLCENQIILAPQGSPEWLAGRSNQFGGSEMSSVLSSNPYTTFEELIQTKVTGNNFELVPCSFGRIFEDVAKKWLETNQTTLSYDTIYDLSNVKSTKYPVAYSPDGLVINLDTDELILLEIKCPFFRRKIENIPPYYLCQVYTGLDVLPVDACHFLQFRFRVCSVFDLDFTPRYNRWVHREPTKTVPDKEPHFFGYVILEDTEEFVNLGSEGPEAFERIIQYKTGAIHFNRKPPAPFKGVILGFKCFNATRKTLQPNPTYLFDHRDTIWKMYVELRKAKLAKEAQSTISPIDPHSVTV